MCEKKLAFWNSIAMQNRNPKIQLLRYDSPCPRLTLKFSLMIATHVLVGNGEHIDRVTEMEATAQQPG